MNALGQPIECPACAGKGFIRVEKDGYPFIKRCSCQKEHIHRRILRNSGLPPKFWQTTLSAKPASGREPFVPYRGSGRHASPADRELAQASHKQALKVCRKLKTLYLNYFVKGKRDEELYGLLLYGKPGRGKTRLICSLLRDLIDEGLADVKFVEYNQLFKQIRASFGNQGPSYRDIFNPLLNASVLAIDDLGTEVTGSTVFLLDQMGYIINERYNKNLPTLFTCNDWISIKDGENELPSVEEKDGKQFESLRSYEYEKYFNKTDRETRSRAETERQMGALQQRVSTRLRSRICEMCLELNIAGFDYRGRIGRNRQLRLERDVLEQKSNA